MFFTIFCEHLNLNWPKYSFSTQNWACVPDPFASEKNYWIVQNHLLVNDKASDKYSLNRFVSTQIFVKY